MSVETPHAGTSQLVEEWIQQAQGPTARTPPPHWASMALSVHWGRYRFEFRGGLCLASPAGLAGPCWSLCWLAGGTWIKFGGNLATPNPTPAPAAAGLLSRWPEWEFGLSGDFCPCSSLPSLGPLRAPGYGGWAQPLQLRRHRGPWRRTCACKFRCKTEPH